MIPRCGLVLLVMAGSKTKRGEGFQQLVYVISLYTFPR